MNMKIVGNGETFWVAVLICKDDLREIFKGNKLATKLIDELSDDDMDYFANKYGGTIMEVSDWSEIAEESFKSVFLEDYDFMKRYFGEDYEEKYKKDIKDLKDNYGLL